MVDPKDSVTDARIQENEKISNKLLESIFAGHMMFSTAPKEEIIKQFQKRFHDRDNPTQTQLTAGGD